VERRADEIEVAKK